MINKDERTRSFVEDQGCKGSQCVLIDHIIENRIKISPKRLVIAVIIAALWDFGVW